MPVLRDIPLEIDVEKLLSREGGAGNQRIREAAEKAARRCLELVRPGVSYRFHDDPLLDGQVFSIGGVRLNIGPLAHLLDSTQRAVAAAVTLGEEISREISAARAEGRAMDSYLLGATALEALGSAGMALKALVEKEAAGLGWGLGPALQPGSLRGWPLTDQEAFCGLAGAGEVGVAPNSHSMLVPFYSVTLLIGMGPGYKEGRMKRACRYCSLNPSCPYRETGD